jgi:hypothetical protein
VGFDRITGMTFSDAHVAAFRAWEAKGRRFDLLRTDQLDALCEDVHFQKSIGDWRQKAITDAARAAERQGRTSGAAVSPVVPLDAEAIADVIASAIKTVADPLAKRIKALEQRNAELERQLAGRALLAAKGLWNARERYAAGDVVVKDGSSWCAMTDNPTTVPGDGSAGQWLLLASRGRPGKDAHE